MEHVHTLSEAKARLSAILDQIERGDEVVITRMGRPIARLVPYKAVPRRARLGFAPRQIRVADDFDEWGDDEARALGLTDAE